MASPTYHPVYLDLGGRSVLIVGAGSIAVEKLHSLLPSGAVITVVAPEACKEVVDWQASSALTWIPREFRTTDIEPAFVVIAATADPELNAEVYRLGNAMNKLTNSVDDPANCNFIMAAVAKSGPMQVAISSSGCSPALAQRVRDRIVNEILSDEIGTLADYLGERRDEVKRSLSGYKARKAFWERVLDSDVPRELATDGAEAADVLFRALLHRAAAQAAEPSSVDRSKVYLVGAGPGDPSLATVRAVEILRHAEVVLYDRLVNPILLAYAPPSAECVYVGKDLGTPGQGRQSAIHDQMIRHVREGKLVVRLKGGDPFVFGRGGEEALALRAAGISFEVVPGISSAIAAAAAAGIPVTHRGVSTAFGVFAGHEADHLSGDRIPWAAAAQMPTAVFLMGIERLPVIVERLITEGRSPETPVAIVSNGTLPNQLVVTGTLETIVGLAVDVPAPAAIVVGDVVNLRDRLVDAPNSVAAESWKRSAFSTSLRLA